MDILFLGMDVIFSTKPLRALFDAGHRIISVVAPSGLRGISGGLPAPDSANANEVDIAATADRCSAPMVDMNRAPESDVIVAACFPRRIPESVALGARFAALNVHPSRLPHYRGPVPVFWQLRDGLQKLGMTIHRISPDLDRGDIVSQTEISVPIGASGNQLNRMLADAGADLLLDVLARANFAGRPQEGKGSYQSYPTDSDWRIPTSWTALRAYNFMKGTSEWGRAYTLTDADADLRADTALGYEIGQAPQREVRPLDDGWRVGMRDGWLMVANRFAGPPPIEV
jgi:methionyl-tRNA formyltransferase